MKPFPIRSTKYDGSLHYDYTAGLVRIEPNLLVVYTPPGISVDSYRGKQIARRHSLELYWSDRYYNIHVNWSSDWQTHSHYVNIATPATWHTGEANYIDLDLDVIWRATTNEVILDDEDEFLLHQQRFGYPAELIAQAWDSSHEVRSLIAQRAYPFDGSLYTWRPNGSA